MYGHGPAIFEGRQAKIHSEARGYRQRGAVRHLSDLAFVWARDVLVGKRLELKTVIGAAFEAEWSGNELRIPRME